MDWFVNPTNYEGIPTIVKIKFDEKKGMFHLMALLVNVKKGNPNQTWFKIGIWLKLIREEVVDQYFLGGKPVSILDSLFDQVLSVFCTPRTGERVGWMQTYWETNGDQYRLDNKGNMTLNYTDYLMLKITC